MIDQNGSSYVLPNQFATLLKLDEKALLLLSETQQQKNSGPLRSYLGRDNPFQLLPSMMDLPLGSFINNAFSLPQDYILEKIKTPSALVLGPFYWSSEIESL